jgi:hypothetical protein
MNFKLIFKALFIVALLSLLVIMGMNNRQTIELSMPGILPHSLSERAALMYIGFFGAGFVAGTVLMAGGAKKSGGSGKSN